MISSLSFVSSRSWACILRDLLEEKIKSNLWIFMDQRF